MFELVIWAALFALCMCAGLLIRSDLEGIFSRFTEGKLKIVCAFLSALCVLWIASFQLEWIRFPIHLDHNPAAVTLLSQAVFLKQPVFFSGTEGDIQLLGYGVYAYAFGSILMPFFDSPFMADKVTGAFLFWSAAVMVAILFIKRFGTGGGFAATLVFLFSLVCLIPLKFELKETVIFFGTAVALFSGFRVRNSLPAMVLAGFGLAVCTVVNAAQAGIASVILLPLIVRERGIKWTAGASGFFLFFVFGIFLHPSFSLEGQWNILQFNSDVYFTNFSEKYKQYPVITGSLIVAIVAAAARTREKFVLASAALSAAVFPACLYSSSLWGTVTDKMFYLIPPLLIIAGEPGVLKGMKGKASLVLGGWFIASLIVCSLPYGDRVSPLRKSIAKKEIITRSMKPAGLFKREAENLSSFLDGLSVEVGVSDLQNYIRYYSAKPFFYEKSPTISYFPIFIMELIELSAVNDKLPEEYMSAQIAAIEDEGTDVFLVPRAGKMFSIVSYYPPNKAMFGADFVSVFLNNYKQIGQSGGYAIFAAKSRAAEISAFLKSRAKTSLRPESSILIF